MMSKDKGRHINTCDIMGSFYMSINPILDKTLFEFVNYFFKNVFYRRKIIISSKSELDLTTYFVVILGWEDKIIYRLWYV